MPRTLSPSKAELRNSWRCPPPHPLDAKGEDRAGAVLAAARRLRWRPDGAAGFAGIELQATLMLLRSDSEFAAADNGFWGAKCQTLLVRPALEPIACAYWTRLSSLALEPKLALAIACTLAGRPVDFRRGAAVGKSSRGDITFEPPGTPAHWLGKIADAAGRDEVGQALPVFVFAQTIMAHPFTDGNGRFARFLVHAALARCCGLSGPALPLAPAFYRHAERLRAGLTRLSSDQKWETLNEAFFSTLEDAVHIGEVLQRRRGSV